MQNMELAIPLTLPKMLLVNKISYVTEMSKTKEENKDGKTLVRTVKGLRPLFFLEYPKLHFTPTSPDKSETHRSFSGIFEYPGANRVLS